MTRLTGSCLYMYRYASIHSKRLPRLFFLLSFFWFLLWERKAVWRRRDDEGENERERDRERLRAAHPKSLKDFVGLEASGTLSPSCRESNASTDPSPDHPSPRLAGSTGPRPINTEQCRGPKLKLNAHQRKHFRDSVVDNEEDVTGQKVFFFLATLVAGQCSLSCPLSQTSFLFVDNLGCWKDTRSRAIPTLEGLEPDLLTGLYNKRDDALRRCALAAIRRGYTTFALQDGGWCASSPIANATYKTYGKINHVPKWRRRRCMGKSCECQRNDLFPSFF